MRIVFATVRSSREFSKILTEQGANSRLLSYHDIKGASDFFEHFCMTGLHPPAKNKPAKTGWKDGKGTYRKQRRLNLLARLDAYEEMGEGDDEAQPRRTTGRVRLGKASDREQGSRGGADLPLVRR